MVHNDFYHGIEPRKNGFLAMDQVRHEKDGGHPTLGCVP